MFWSQVAAQYVLLLKRSTFVYGRLNLIQSTYLNTFYLRFLEQHCLFSQVAAQYVQLCIVLLLKRSTFVYGRLNLIYT